MAEKQTLAVPELPGYPGRRYVAEQRYVTAEFP